MSWDRRERYSCLYVQFQRELKVRRCSEDVADATLGIQFAQSADFSSQWASSGEIMSCMSTVRSPHRTADFHPL
jgi:hypothetical protein